MWCGMTIDAHRESGLVAKTPCGMLKRGFVAAEPAKQRSTGEVAAPDSRTVLDCPCASPCTTSAACKARQEFNATLSGSLDLVEKLATSVERVAVVQYLRRMSKSEALPWAAECALARHADAIEKGEHCK